MTTGKDGLRTGPKPPRPGTTHAGYMVQQIQTESMEMIRLLLEVVFFVFVESSTGRAGKLCRDWSDWEIQPCSPPSVPCYMAGTNV